MPFMSVQVKKKKLNIDNFRGGIVRVGWCSGMRYKDDLPVAMVARWNEFGTVSGRYRIPPRPFMRPAVYEHQQELNDVLKSMYKDALANNKDTMKTLAQFGEKVVARIQHQMDITKTPPNAYVTLHGGWLRSASGKPFYVHKKRGSNPLIDTGFMQETVSYQIEEKRK